MNPDNVVIDFTGGIIGGETTGGGKFDNIMGSVTFDGNTAYLPRSVWETVEDKDGLLKEAENDGFTLLIK